MTHPLAGEVAPREIWVDLPQLITAYYSIHPDMENAGQRISFGTSGHRGSSLNGSFNEDHILAISQAICDYRAFKNIKGPLFLGKDSHALSTPAHQTAVEVFLANGVELKVEQNDRYVPTPSISRAILRYNKPFLNDLTDPRCADGVVITPSHNPPKDGGFKYNPPNGGPADTSVTKWIEDRANAICKEGNKAVKRSSGKVTDAMRYDYITPYVEELASIIDFDVIAHSGLKIGVDPLGGASLDYWMPIAERYKINLELVHNFIDYSFSFMTVDHDGQIRMDCSSPYAMKSLIALKNKYDIAFGNDTDSDRHGIIAPSLGLMNPNHYLAVCIEYLFGTRNFKSDVAVGKTLVSSSLIDRVCAKISRKVVETPVGFKWFSEGLLKGELGFAGEESAGASFLCKDGSVWSTDKDGLIADLLAAEMTARTGKDPGELYTRLANDLGRSVYARIDAPANDRERQILKKLSADAISSKELAGEKIEACLTEAPGNHASIGGLKICTKNGWVAARPSGTEAIYKIYAESFLGREHLEKIQTEAQEIVSEAFRK